MQDTHLGDRRLVDQRMKRAATAVLERALAQIDESIEVAASEAASPAALRAGPLYDGLAGITALRLEAAILSQNSEQAAKLEIEVERLAQAAFRMPDTQFGFYDGYLGIAYVLSRYASTWKSEKHIEVVHRLIARAERIAETTNNWDIIGGAAGAILALLAGTQMLPSDQAVQAAERFGATLLRCART
ncbi:MAG: hypothetical protein K2Y26_17995, partial [Gemmatimonadaceae bacterium]|nr:hypothetical protein [Gemmatimonadaceae bacterium]